MSDDKKSEFLAAVASVLEVPSIGMADDFRATADWCSLKAFGLLVMMENDFGVPLRIDEFSELHTVAELWERIKS